MAAGEMTSQPLDDFFEPIAGKYARLDRLATRRHFIELADVHLAILRERQRPRDRRGGHH